MLKAKREEVSIKIESLKKSNPNYSAPIKLDLETSSTILEVDQGEELKQFYDLKDPSLQTIIIAKVLLLLLGKSDLIKTDEITFENIKKYFHEEMEDKICILILQNRQLFP